MKTHARLQGSQCKSCIYKRVFIRRRNIYFVQYTIRDRISHSIISAPRDIILQSTNCALYLYSMLVICSIVNMNGRISKKTSVASVVLQHRSPAFDSTSPTHCQTNTELCLRYQTRCNLLHTYFSRTRDGGARIRQKFSLDGNRSVDPSVDKIKVEHRGKRNSQHRLVTW